MICAIISDFDNRLMIDWLIGGLIDKYNYEGVLFTVKLFIDWYWLNDWNWFIDYWLIDL